MGDTVRCRTGRRGHLRRIASRDRGQGAVYQALRPTDNGREGGLPRPGACAMMRSVEPEARETDEQTRGVRQGQTPRAARGAALRSTLRRVACLPRTEH